MKAVLFTFGALLPLIHYKILIPYTALVGATWEFQTVSTLSMLLVLASRHYFAAFVWYGSTLIWGYSILIMPQVLSSSSPDAEVFCAVMTLVYGLAAWLDR